MPRHFVPPVADARDLGRSDRRWRALYVQQLSDGTITVSLAELGIVTGLQGVLDAKADLDANGLVPLSQLPASTKSGRVVPNIAARDAIPPAERYESMVCLVTDATGDPTVDSGAASYVWDGSSVWIKIAEHESMDSVVDWLDVMGKPSVFPPSAHAHAVADVTGLQAALDGKLSAGGVAYDSSRLGGQLASLFARNNVANTFSGGVSNFVAGLQKAGVDVVDTNDSRLSNARTPTAHKSTHASGGADALTPADIGALPATAQAADSAKLGGVQASNFLRSDVDNGLANGKHIRFPHANQLDGNDGKIGAVGIAEGLNIIGVQTAAGQGRKIYMLGRVDIVGGLYKDGQVVVLDNDSRLSDARTPLAHAHAILDVNGLQIALDGKLGATAQAADSAKLGSVLAAKFARNDVANTFSGGVSNFTAGLQKGGVDVVDTNDARLSDARSPLAHTHAYVPLSSPVSSGYLIRDAVSYAGTNGQTGCIVLRLPKSWSNTMLSGRLVCYNYISGDFPAGCGSSEVVWGGYNSISAQWRSLSAELRGDCPGPRVRFGHDGTSCVLIIGDTTSVWNYSKIVLAEVVVSHSDTTGWDTGWSISVVADISTYTDIKEPTLRRAPPYSHASAAATYGAASETNYGHVQLATATPSALGAASKGAGTRAAKEDHVHPMPTATDVGALAVGGTAADSAKLGTIPAAKFARNEVANTFSGGVSNFTAGLQKAGVDVVDTNDSRLSNARTPTAHKSTHASGGADALTPADIGAAALGHNHDGLYMRYESGTIAQVGRTQLSMGGASLREAWGSWGLTANVQADITFPSGAGFTQTPRVVFSVFGGAQVKYSATAPTTAGFSVTADQDCTLHYQAIGI